MDEPFITAPFYPPSVLITGLIVNSRGMRFVAEDSYHARTSQFVLEQSGSAAYLIVDSAHLEQPQMPLVPLLDGYETVAEMEAGLGLPAGSLARTLARYNHHAALGRTRTSARALTGWHRRTRARGRSSTCDSATRSTPGSLWGVCAPPWTHKYSVPAVRSSRGCTQPELARPISPRTARATAQAPSSARGHSSAGGLAGTRLSSGQRASLRQVRHSRRADRKRAHSPIRERVMIVPMPLLRLMAITSCPALTSGG